MTSDSSMCINTYYATADVLSPTQNQSQYRRKSVEYLGGTYEIPDFEPEDRKGMSSIPRPTLINHMISLFPEYLQNEPETEQIRFLREKYNCNCSDCDGNDYSCKCNVEEAFFTLFDIPYPKYYKNENENENHLTNSKKNKIKNKTRFSLTYEDYQYILKNSVDL